MDEKQPIIIYQNGKKQLTKEYKDLKLMKMETFLAEINKLLENKKITDSSNQEFFGKITIVINNGKKVNLSVEQTFK